MKTKKAIGILLGVTIAIISTSCKGKTADIYPKTFIVTGINTNTDTVILTDYSGYTWTFKGVEDWMVNDICSCIMSDNATENIKDDAIIEKRYSGNIELTDKITADLNHRGNILKHKTEKLLTFGLECDILNQDGKSHIVQVDRIEDGNYAVIAVHYGKNHRMIDIKQDDFNVPVKQCQILNSKLIYGKFDDNFEAKKQDRKTETYYHFKSNDDAVWWALTENEIGFIPAENTEYALIYSDNGTTADNKPCDCLAEYECECEVYDDIFYGIFEK